MTLTSKPLLIAEIGCSHVGSMDRAKMLIKLAHDSGANVAKFQKRNPKESTPKHLWNKPHPNQRFAYGSTYLEHRVKLELSLAQHAELKKYCEEIGIIYATSVWDITSAQEIATLKPLMVKIPSAQNDKTDLLDCIYENYTGMVHISTGMTTLDERTNLILKAKDRDPNLERTIIYHCTSAYPCPFENLYLHEISWLREVCPNIGFSNHGYGIAADIAALALGARYFERHFIDDRIFPHTDAAASLEPGGMQKLSRDLQHICSALEVKPRELCSLEAEQRDKLRS
jgi:sialic acid synthase